MTQFAPVSETCELVTRTVVDGVFFPMESVVNFRLAPALTNALTATSGVHRDGDDVIVNRNAFARLSFE
ncbi:hypothetical protein [Algihabitans sp.]|uniref:hypothetical protein n=1 Tax=Algihabitans sp. TaxID=2821514 RepID=UPI003BA8B9FF